MLLISTLVLGCSCFASPDSPLEGKPVEGAFAQAIERCRSNDEDGAMKALTSALEAEPDAVQRALLEPAFVTLRDAERFRTAVHDAAVKHRISRLVLVPKEEPGEWIEVEGRLVDASGAAVPGGIVQVFATDTQGRYHPTIEGERLARIFGTLVSDAQGRFSFATVRPGPYPGTRNARHVHLSARAGDLRLACPSYMVFDDDPLLEEPHNAEQRGEAVKIQMRLVDGKHRGTLVLPMR